MAEGIVIKQELHTGPRNNKCFICSCLLGTSLRGCFNIFEANVTSSIGSSVNKVLADSLTDILGIEINQESVHSHVICKKCYKLLCDINDLEVRVVYLKSEVYKKYHEGLQRDKENEPGPIVISVDPNQVLSDNEWETAEEGKRANGEATKSNTAPQQTAAAPTAAPSTEKEKSEPPAKRARKEVVPRYVKIEPLPQEIEEDVCETYEITLDNDSDVESGQYYEEDVIVEAVQEKDDDDDTGVYVQVIPGAGQELKCVTKEQDEYICAFCDKRFSGARYMTEHLKKMHEITLHICEECDKTFDSYEDLINHMNEHPSQEQEGEGDNEAGEFQCEVCNKILNSFKELQKHSDIHHGKRFECEECGEVCKTKNMLKVHQKKSHKKFCPYKCEECSMEFATKTNWAVHMKVHKMQAIHLTCRYCGKVASSPLRLERHESLHGGQKDFVCSTCGKTYATIASLKNHTLTHQDSKRFVCNVCGKPFRTKRELADHERIHTGERPYQCEICGMSFGRSSNLWLHKQATHFDDIRYKCDICGKGFKRRRLVNFHKQAVHTGERHTKCPQCPATFVYPWHLKKHLRIHTGEKPYNCEICGKAFSTSENRNAHRYIHSSKKQYECCVCGAGFMRKPQLFLHMKNEGHINDTIIVNQSTAPIKKEIKIEPVQEMEEGTMLDGHTQIYIQSTDEHVIIPELAQADGAVHVYSIEDNDMDHDDDRVQHVIIEGPIHFSEMEEGDMNEMGAVTYEVTEDESGRPTLVIPAASVISDPSVLQGDAVMINEGMLESTGSETPMVIRVTIPEQSEKAN